MPCGRDDAIMTNMKRVAIHACAGLAVLAAAWAGAPPLAAQPAPQIGADGESEAATPPPAKTETRGEELDRLHGELAAATDASAAEEIVGRIQKIWARSGSDSMDLLLSRARSAMQAEDYARARIHLAALNRLAPEFAEGWNASATLRYLQEDYARAAIEIERVLALEPRHFSALTGLALIFEQTRRKESAMKTWREVEKLYPAFEKAQEAIERLSPEVDGREL